MSMRVRRTSFGPKLRDRRKIANPELDIPARSFNRAFSVIAGVSQAGAQAWAIVEFVARQMKVLSHAELWNPNGGAEPVATRSAAGSYLLTYPATFTTPEGETGSLVLYGALAVPQSLDELDGRAKVTDAIKVDVRIRDAADALADAPVLVVVW